MHPSYMLHEVCPVFETFITQITSERTSEHIPEQYQLTQKQLLSKFHVCPGLNYFLWPAALHRLINHTGVIKLPINLFLNAHFEHFFILFLCQRYFNVYCTERALLTICILEACACACPDATCL